MQGVIFLFSSLVTLYFRVLGGKYRCVRARVHCIKRGGGEAGMYHSSIWHESTRAGMSDSEFSMGRGMH